MGAKCLSDFFRTVMLESPSGAPATGGLMRVEQRVRILDGRLAAMESELVGVRNMLSTSKDICQKP